MERLGRDLDADRIPSGALLTDRTFRYGWEALAGSFRAVKVIAEIKPAEGARRWDEVVWLGNPGERSVWVIAPTTTRTQEVLHVALQGAPVAAGESPALRYYLPYRVTGSPVPQTADLPLDFLRLRGMDTLGPLSVPIHWLGPGSPPSSERARTLLCGLGLHRHPAPRSRRPSRRWGWERGGAPTAPPRGSSPRD